MRREDFEIESDWMTVEGRYTFVATAFAKDTHRVCAVAQLQLGMKESDFIARSPEQAVKAIEIGVVDTCELPKMAAVSFVCSTKRPRHFYTHVVTKN